MHQGVKAFGEGVEELAHEEAKASGKGAEELAHEASDGSYFFHKRGEGEVL